MRVLLASDALVSHSSALFIVCAADVTRYQVDIKPRQTALLYVSKVCNAFTLSKRVSAFERPQIKERRRVRA